jgi:hypothetical protein
MIYTFQIFIFIYSVYIQLQKFQTEKEIRNKVTLMVCICMSLQMPNVACIGPQR